MAVSSAPPVPVARPVQKLVTDYVDYTGRLNAKNSVVIQPRVTGYLVTDDDNDKDKMAFSRKETSSRKTRFSSRSTRASYKARSEAVA